MHISLLSFFETIVCINSDTFTYCFLSGQDLKIICKNSAKGRAINGCQWKELIPDSLYILEAAQEGMNVRFQKNHF